MVTITCEGVHGCLTPNLSAISYRVRITFDCGGWWFSSGTPTYSTNKTKQTKINKEKFKKKLYDSLVLYLTKKWLKP
jgi:hypothetical protein